MVRRGVLQRGGIERRPDRLDVGAGGDIPDRGAVRVRGAQPLGLVVDGGRRIDLDDILSRRDSGGIDNSIGAVRAFDRRETMEKGGEKRRGNVNHAACGPLANAGTAARW